LVNPPLRRKVDAGVHARYVAQAPLVTLSPGAKTAKDPHSGSHAGLMNGRRRYARINVEWISAMTS
jgi:hypothetical protein